MSGLARLRARAQQLSIRQQVLATTAAALVLFFGSLVLFAHTTNRLLVLLYQGERYEQTLAATENLRRLMGSLETNLYAYAESGRPGFLRSYQVGQQAFDYEIERILTLVAETPEEAGRFQAAVRYADQWHTQPAAHAIRLRRAGQDSRPVLAAAESRETLELFYDALRLFTDLQTRRLQELRAQAEALVRRMIYLALFLSVVGLLGSLWCTTWLAHRLTRPLDQLLESLGQVESGSLMPAVPFTEPPEMVYLAQRFRSLLGALHRSRHQLEAFQAFTEQLHRGQTAEELRRAFLQAVESPFQPEQVLLLAADPGSGTLQVAERLAAAAPGAPELMTLPQECPAVRTSKPFGVADTTREAVCACELGVPRAGSYHCLPLIGGSSLLGLACLTGPPRHWTPERAAPLDRYVGRLADALYARELLARAQTEAMMDGLTGLYNRRFAEEYLTKLLALSRRTQRPFSVLLLDLDHLKALNDCFGHAAGDLLLRAFADDLNHGLRRSAIAARWGGDEFLVVLPEEDLEGARQVAERLRLSTVQIRLAPPLSDLTLTVSIGMAVFPVHGRDNGDLLQAADRALYQAKRVGRNRIEAPTSLPSIA